MFDHEDTYYEDPLAVSKGIGLGLLLGSLMWAGIIGGYIYFLRLN